MSGDDFDHDPEGLANLILAYLRERPAAADSARGIGQWWLGRDGEEPDPVALDAALELLEARGYIRRIVNPDGTVLFTRRRDD